MSYQDSFNAANKGIIIAADVASIEELRELVGLSLDVPEVVSIKIGFRLALRYGLPPIVKAVHQLRRLPVVYDHQKAATDIPAMGRPFARVCADAEVSAVIFFPLAGPKTLESFIVGAQDNGLSPIVGLSMTHPGYLQSEGGFISDNAVGLISKVALSLGVRDFVLPGNRPEMVKSICEGILSSEVPLRILMPGIGAQGGQVSQAFNAVGNHHPFAIIGSSIYASADPRKALRNLVAEVRDGR